MRSKECRRCGKLKPRSNFSKSSRNKDGLISYCKDCDSVLGKDWYSRNKKKNKIRSLKWKKENKERFAEYQSDWANKNKIQIKKRLSEWYKKNKTRLSKQAKKWRKDNPNKVRLYKHNYYSKLKNQLGEVSPNIIEKLLQEQKGCCLYCGNKLKKWHLEHMLPISRGGQHDDTNLCLACPRCNLKKQTRTAEEFMADMGGN